MAKGQMKPNREAKKPKKNDKKSGAVGPSTGGRSAYQQSLKPKS
jgi:hypothetical protein